MASFIYIHCSVHLGNRKIWHFIRLNWSKRSRPSSWFKTKYYNEKNNITASTSSYHSPAPLTSQYLNLTKNSSLAVAIGYQDIVSIGDTVLNQSGRVLEVISIFMVFYLTLSLITSAFMNWYNKKIKLVER